MEIKFGYLCIQEIWEYYEWTPEHGPYLPFMLADVKCHTF